MNTNRRKFLTSTTALTASAAAGGMLRWGVESAEAAGAPDYKALVCVFLFGGSDSNNMIIPFTDYAQFLSIRNGDIHIPQVSMVEPLEVECRHFVECVEQGKRPLTDGASALRVVRVLEAAQRSLESRGAPVDV